jgi:TRAP-type C4-dicarboxylate transport system permease small subunit
MVFANVTMVLLGVGLAVRRRDLVAMQAAYEMLPRRLAHVLDFLWNLLILGFACVFTWYGYQAARNISGEYWELGMLSRSYPMMILPVAGVLISPPVSRCSAKTFVS